MTGLDRVLVAFLVLSTFSAVQERVNEAVRQSALGFAERWWPGGSEGWTTYLGRQLTSGGWNVLLAVAVACALNANLLSLFERPTASAAVDGQSPRFFCEYAWGPCAPERTAVPLREAMKGGVAAAVGLACFGVSAGLHFGAHRAERERSAGAARAWGVADVCTLAGLVLMGVALWLELRAMGLTMRWFFGCAAMGAATALGSRFWHDLAFGLTEARKRGRAIVAEVKVPIGSFPKDE